MRSHSNVPSDSGASVGIVAARTSILEYLPRSPLSVAYREAAGVLIDVEASDEVLDRFVARVEADKPLHATIETLTSETLAPVGYTSFEIRASETNGARTTLERGSTS